MVSQALNQRKSVLNQSLSKDTGLIIGVAASAFMAPSLAEGSLKECDLTPTPIVARAEPGDFDLGQIELPQGPPAQLPLQQPAEKAASKTEALPPSPVNAPQSPPQPNATDSLSAPPTVGTTQAPQFIGPPLPPESEKGSPAENPLTRGLTPADLTAITESIRAEIRTEMESRAAAVQSQEKDTSLFWKGLTIITAFMAVQGYWRWRYRTQDDFRKKASDLRGMLHDESLYFEDSKFVVAYDRSPKNTREMRQLIVENPRTPRDLDTDLEMIIGPYCSDHLRRAALRCTPDDPFVMDHVGEVPISWAWIRDEFFRWEFGSAMRLWRAKQNNEQRFTTDLIHLRLKTALESSLGEQAIDILEGRDRSPRHFLIAVMCDVQKNEASPTGEMRRIVVRVIPDDQFGLYGDPKIVQHMRDFNRDTVARDIDLIAKLHDREHRTKENTYENGAGLLPGHPRANRPSYDYSEAVRLILRPAEGTPADPARIQVVYGEQNPSTESAANS